MSKKNIIKLNEKYFSCNPINENFDDLPVINAETEDKIQIQIADKEDKIQIADKEDKIQNIESEDKIKIGKPIKINSKKSNEKTISSQDSVVKPIFKQKEEPEKKKKVSKKVSKKRSKKRSKKGSKKRSKKRSKRRSKKGSKKRSKKRSKKSSKKGSKKRREGFCAGNTCITESDLKNIINLLKNLEFKK